MNSRPLTAREVFLQAIEIPAGPDRQRYALAACGQNPTLLREVEALLQANESAGSFLAHPATGLELDEGAAETDDTLAAGAPGGPTETVGEHIGRYRLLEQIGEGGFGVVYLAEQREPVMRQVALKIIKLGMDTRQVVARFEAERQALALMDHPNIARVLDGGSTAAGRPYFVMEYIRGVPMLEHCNRERLDTKQRLDLFASVCDAIQHAHHKGIIHRDIKPSNVLITMSDGRAVAKVIDFGVAKATRAELTSRSLVTEHRQLIGTPAYMSPEQAEGLLDIDTRTDVYSLGVLLYELLTGSTPFDTGSLRGAARADLQRMIREVDPPRPSTRVSQSAELLASIAAQRRTEPRRLSTIIRGELDWIVMKCLEKARHQRYETASALALDLRRFLAGEAVAAGPRSASYRFRKFVRRNRGAVTAGLMVTMALTLGLAGTAWQAVRAAEQRDAAIAAREAEARQRQAADAERDKATLIADFMSTILNGAGPSAARGRDITMLKELLDGAAARIHAGDLRNSPAAELRLRGSIGNTYRQLALYAEAAAMLEPAIALARSLHPGDHVAKAYALTNFAILLQDRGNLEDAEPLSREALEITRRLFPGDNAEVAVALFNRTRLHEARGEQAEAEALYDQVLAMHSRMAAGDHLNIVAALSARGTMLRRRGDWVRAERLAREALAMAQRLRTGDDPIVAVSLDNLANALRGMKRADEAEPLLVRSLEMRRRLYPGDHPDLATGINNLADLLLSRGDRAAAEPLLLEALAMLERLYPGDHPLVLMAKGNLAALYWVLGRLDQSIPLFEQALAGQAGRLGRAHPDTLRTIANTGVNYKDAGRIAEAIPLLEEAYRAAKRFPHLSYAGPALLEACAKGAAAGRPDDREQALALLPRLLADTRAAHPGESAALAAALVQLATPLLDLSAWDEAEPLLREALAIRQASASDAWTTFNTTSLLGAALLGQCRFSEAESMLLAGYDGMKQREGTIPPRAATRLPEALRRIVQLYESWDQAEPGQGYDEESAEWKTQLPPPAPPALH